MRDAGRDGNVLSAIGAAAGGAVIVFVLLHAYTKKSKKGIRTLWVRLFIRYQRSGFRKIYAMGEGGEFGEFGEFGEYGKFDY